MRHTAKMARFSHFAQILTQHPKAGGRIATPGGATASPMPTGGPFVSPCCRSATGFGFCIVISALPAAYQWGHRLYITGKSRRAHFCASQEMAPGSCGCDGPGSGLSQTPPRRRRRRRKSVPATAARAPPASAAAASVPPCPGVAGAAGALAAVRAAASPSGDAPITLGLTAPAPPAAWAGATAAAGAARAAAARHAPPAARPLNQPAAEAGAHAADRFEQRWYARPCPP